MLPNSCFYRAVRDVCRDQFSIDISTSMTTFDKYNRGDGVPLENFVPAINDSLSPWNVTVLSITGNITGEFPHRYLCVGPGKVEAPCIGIVDSGTHAIPILNGSGWIDCVLGIKLQQEDIAN